MALGLKFTETKDLGEIQLKSRQQGTKHRQGKLDNRYSLPISGCIS